MCSVCYREMRSDVLKRHMKKHSKKNERVPATKILVTNNIYNKPPSVSTSDPIKQAQESLAAAMSLSFTGGIFSP